MNAEAMRPSIHQLTITKGEDWFEDQHDWRGDITCLVEGGCHGWWECREPHAIDGVDASDGPFNSSAEGAPWDDCEEFEFHGVMHTWVHWGGWTVPYPGCIVQSADLVVDDAYEIGEQHGEGTYLVDTDWEDVGECRLIFWRAAEADEATA